MAKNINLSRKSVGLTFFIFLVAWLVVLVIINSVGNEDAVYVTGLFGAGALLVLIILFYMATPAPAAPVPRPPAGSKVLELRKLRDNVLSGLIGLLLGYYYIFYRQSDFWLKLFFTLASVSWVIYIGRNLNILRSKNVGETLGGRSAVQFGLLQSLAIFGSHIVWFLALIAGTGMHQVPNTPEAGWYIIFGIGFVGGIAAITLFILHKIWFNRRIDRATTKREVLILTGFSIGLAIAFGLLISWLR